MSEAVLNGVNRALKCARQAYDLVDSHCCWRGEHISIKHHCEITVVNTECWICSHRTAFSPLSRPNERPYTLCHSTTAKFAFESSSVNAQVYHLCMLEWLFTHPILWLLVWIVIVLREGCLAIVVIHFSSPCASITPQFRFHVLTKHLKYYIQISTVPLLIVVRTLMTFNFSRCVIFKKYRHFKLNRGLTFH